MVPFPVPDSPEAREPRSASAVRQELDSVRYELHVRTAARNSRSQIVIWCYEDGACAAALMPIGGAMERITRWTRMSPRT